MTTIRSFVLFLSVLLLCVSAEAQTPTHKAATIVGLSASNNTRVLSFEAATTNMSVKNNGDTVFVIKNAGASPTTITVDSKPDAYGRVLDLTLTLAQNETGIIGPLNPAVYNTLDGGKVFLAFSNITTVTIASVNLH